MTCGKQWKREDLPLDTVVTREDFQFRTGGLSVRNINRIVATLRDGGEAKDPVRVARVGRVLYLVDGFHRLEAYRRTGRRTIPAEVAKMGMGEAKGEAMRLNAMNGMAYTRADKQSIWDAYVADGRHLEANGKARGSRTVSAELGGVYSHQTIRTKIKAMGLEFDEREEFPGGYKPRLSDSNEDDLLEALELEAEHHLHRFGALIAKLAHHDRERLLQVARGVVSAAERGQEPDVSKLLEEASAF